MTVCFHPLSQHAVYVLKSTSQTKITANWIISGSKKEEGERVKGVCGGLSPT